MYSFLSTLAVILVAISHISAKDKPNILFIFADDQCYKTIRAQ